MSVLLALTLAASADEVLWYEGNGGYSTSATHMAGVLTAAGATGFDDTTSWPSDFSDYRLVFLVASSTAYDASQTADLQDFVDDGGILVLLGENTDVSTTIASTYNDLLADLGATSEYVSDRIDTGCGNYGTVVAKHPYADGVSSPEYASPCDLTVGSGATSLIEGSSGHVLLAAEGSLALATDMNMFDDSCTLTSGNEQLWENLFNPWVQVGCGPWERTDVSLAFHHFRPQSRLWISGCALCVLLFLKIPQCDVRHDKP